MPRCRQNTAQHDHGAIKSPIDQIWNAFWSGGISNPIEVIEQITYLLFLRRLDDVHTLGENKATRLKEPVARRVFPAGRDPEGRPSEDLRWSRFKHFAPGEMYVVVSEHVFPFLRTLGGDDSTYARHMKDALHDASMFMDWQARYYPMDVFGTLRVRLEALIASGEAQAVEFVSDELKAVAPPAVQTWAKAQSGLFVPLDADLQKAGAEIEASYPDLADHRGIYQSADAYVVALARTRGGTVVSQETRAAEKKNAKQNHYIPVGLQA